MQNQPAAAANVHLPAVFLVTESEETHTEEGQKNQNEMLGGENKGENIVSFHRFRSVVVDHYEEREFKHYWSNNSDGWIISSIFNIILTSCVANMSCCCFPFKVSNTWCSRISVQNKQVAHTISYFPCHSGIQASSKTYHLFHSVCSQHLRKDYFR